MMNHHQFLSFPPGLQFGAFNGPSSPPMPGPSQSQSLPPVCSLKCPECHQTFTDSVSLYAHASHSHYWNILASLFMSDFLLVKGKCSICPRGAVLKSVNAYIKHMGGKHRLINKFMTPELLTEYSKLPTSEAEFQDVQALLDMGEQPERNLMKKVKEKEKSKKISQRVHSGKPPGLPSTSYDVSFPPTMVPQFNFTSDPRNVSQFLAAGSAAAFADLNEPDLRRLTKKGRIRKSMQSTPLKCPECELTFDHASTLYTHAAGKHYYNQLVDLFKTNFMRSDGMCTGCPNRPINDVQSYVLHVGAKHKMIHQFISPDMLREYQKLPKRINSGYTTVKNSSLINCIICGVNAKRKFSNITEYKQHLAIFHFRNQISAAYMSSYPSGSSELTCSICNSRGEESGKVYKSFYAIIVHLGSRHNCILDFAEEPLKAQLVNFNVYKN